VAAGAEFRGNPILYAAVRNLKLLLAYDGTDFHGWQVQPDRPTVQGLLASAIERVTDERTLPQGSGRTDAGVHALGQVASVAIASPIPLKNLVIALNDTLPAAVRVLSVEEAGPEFHARHAAKAKTYRYRMYRGDICPPFVARYVYHHPYPLDEPAMMAAAGTVEGEHDFTSFAAADPDRTSREEGEPADNVRTVYSSGWRREGEELVYEIRGNGFLHHMVRNLVGTFLLAGKGKLDRAGMRRILEAWDRSKAGATAPASGLVLVSVEY
jgi:tRNA pseudouridine38-40 synthase